ncbi:helix-turn-helix domain-containing protein [Frigidibacter mobilis]|uniref:HTH araC/xylS-type domain-containing protein n=1 Tax=Frigidibacter mobilis TaxID=1335048 RepID=A0A159Z1E3_9RHOB|nr:AraC family transcriptional regulator [Frigidibacter mobilis]AMY68756.1 hypothetical protein AKL17_1503 [Frigidibacter mobilis]
MSQDPEFVGQTEGITPVAPPQWRRLDGVMGIFWEARGARGANGYYLSNHPRISLFFNDVSSIRISNDPGAARQPGRPMARVLYIPAGMPMWTRFTADHAFSHLDIHLHRDRLLKMLVPALGRSAALEVLARPVETAETRVIDTLAGLLLDEIRAPSRHPLHAETLVAGMVTGLLDLGNAEPDRAGAQLTKRQMRKLVACFRAGGGHGLSVSDMSRAVGLSESWFSHLFKNTTGTTPLQWQLRQRVELAQGLLSGSGLSVADVAGRLGFSDQAHLTKVFRHVTGETPAAWRRTHDAARPALDRPRGPV